MFGNCINTRVAERLVDETYFNFSNAMNNDLHPRLLDKLKGYKILKLMIEFLSNRCRTVKVNLMKLVPGMVLSLILQGSVPGSIKFLHIYK